MMLPASLLDWEIKHVKEWLILQEFTQYCHLLCDIHRIDGPALLMLTEDDLKKPPLNIQVLGDVKKLTLSLYHLRMQHKDDLMKSGISQYTGPFYQFKIDGAETDCRMEALKNQIAISSDKAINCKTPRENHRSSTPDYTNLDDPNCASPADGNPTSNGMATRLEPEIGKTILGASYFVIVTIITSLVMVVVHDRVPDMKKYPPLPDIFLDSVPLIPWAFGMCEVVGCILTLTWILVLVFHKHRFILMRRFFALTGSVFLLRCVTMIITSLSVPGAHLECAPRPYGDMWAKLDKALHIWNGFGMSVQGVRTCGDYMFSGHTVILTMLNFFITEYTPRRLYFLHTFTWILNLFGIFFILAAHEHYSIDVFIAFYITSRLFLYYHTLANSRTLRQRDNYRAKIWFPLFSFFESRIDGMVPNEYQIPWADFSLAPLQRLVFRIFRAVDKSPDPIKKNSSHKKSKKKS